MTNNLGAPLVSVVMGVYNCESTVAAAIESIANQTLHDWEIIICDDGSTDTTAEVVRQQVATLRHATVITNASNLGLAASLNRCLAKSTGFFIARMDADDVCESRRLETQVRFLEAHPDISFVGTGATFFDEVGTWGSPRLQARPTKKDLIRGTQFIHPTVMLRRQALNDVGGYSEAKRDWRVEDYRLWIALYAKGHVGANILQPLLAYRNDRAALGRRTWRARVNEALAMFDAATLFEAGVAGRGRAMKPLAMVLLPEFIYRSLYRRAHRSK